MSTQKASVKAEHYITDLSLVLMHHTKAEALRCRDCRTHWTQRTCNKTPNPACASISKHSKWRRNTEQGELYGWTHPKSLSSERMNESGSQFLVFLRTERTNNAAETNKGKEIIGKSTVRKALLTTMLRGIVSTALSRNIFSPKAAKKQLCEQRKERRGGKKEKTKWNHTIHMSISTLGVDGMSHKQHFKVPLHNCMTKFHCRTPGCLQAFLKMPTKAARTAGLVCTIPTSLEYMKALDTNLCFQV